MIKQFILPAFLLATTLPVSAEIIAPLSDSSYWTIMSGADEDQTSYKLTPGYGGQYFDAEYLLYNYNTTTHDLTIALQTGFDITGDNHIMFDGKSYWGGDLALSFNGITLGNSSTYEYAIDFGQATGTWSDRSSHTPSIAASAAGLYAVSSWNNDVYSSHSGSVPLAMQSGSLAAAAVSIVTGDSSGYFNSAGYGGNNTSYYKTMSFNLDTLGIDVLDTIQLDAHWTMSCGNDAINGYVEIPASSVPEPSMIILLSTGLTGLLGSLVARRRKFI